MTVGERSSSPEAFQTTHWTAVLAARGDSPAARDALRALCDAYYAPVFAFVRHYRHGAEDARDLTHDFFAKLLEGNKLNRLDRGQGRFRSYLLGAVKHFLADHRDRQSSQKRGSGQLPGPLETTDAADPAAFPDDAYFDREWALTVLTRSLDRLEREAADKGQGDQVAALRPWLTGDAPSASSVAVAQQLGLAEGSMKVIVHRLRKRFREFVREELARTVAPDEIGPELDYLIRALSQCRA